MDDAKHHPLSDEHAELLLQVARHTVESHVLGSTPPAPAVDLDGPPFDRKVGLFVTFHVDDQLRGCMGTFHPEAHLGRMLPRMARTSLRDPRFLDRPIGAKDLGSLKIEVSVLSPMWPTRDPLAELKPGVHGVLVQRGQRGGCFLPQVATEQGWDARQMLSHCCAGKAGLPPAAWQETGTEVFLFTAQILRE